MVCEVPAGVGGGGGGGLCVESVPGGRLPVFDAASLWSAGWLLLPMFSCIAGEVAV